MPEALEDVLLGMVQEVAENRITIDVILQVIAALCASKMITIQEVISAYLIGLPIRLHRPLGAN